MCPIPQLWYFTDDVLAEYAKVFDYERLRRLDRRRIARFRSLLVKAGVVVKSRGRLEISEHADDNRIYECAVASKADYIVTENIKHFNRPHKMTKDRHSPATPAIDE